MTATPPPGRLVDIGGRRLHLLAAGDDAPTVVLIVGGGMPGLFMHPVLERVAGFSRVCLYDRAGFGWSDPAPAPMSFDDLAGDLHALLASAGEPAPYVLVGESFGGLVARAFARRWPNVTAGLVLVDSAEEGHVFGKLDLLMDSARRQLGPARLLSALGLARRMAKRALPPVYQGDTRDLLAALLGRGAHWVAAAQEVLAYGLTPEAERAPGGFGRLASKPLRVIAHGKPFPSQQAGLEVGWRAGQERLTALSDRGCLIVADRCGHGIAQEDPDLVAQEIRQVVEQVRQGA